MTLLFGELTQAFVDFGVAVERDRNNYSAAANHFRDTAASTAGYLAVLGLGMMAVTYTYMLIWYRYTIAIWLRITDTL